MIGDGLIIRKPYRSYISVTKIQATMFYRMASSIIFGEPERTSKKKRPLSSPGIINKNTFKLITLVILLILITCFMFLYLILFGYYIGLDHSPTGFGMPLFLPSFVDFASPIISVGLWLRPQSSLPRILSLLTHLTSQLKHPTQFAHMREK